MKSRAHRSVGARRPQLLNKGDSFRRRLWMETLEDRRLLSLDLVSTADPAVPIPANGLSYGSSISDDGRYVAYTSSSTDLVVGDTNGSDDVFVTDMTTRTATVVSTDSAGTQANGNCSSAVISADGLNVAFRSYASNLVPGGNNGYWHVFIKHLTSGITTLVSSNSVGNQGDGPSAVGGISADGRYVAFFSSGDNLVSGDTNGTQDIFVKDLATGITTRANTSSSGAQANNWSEYASISADGRYVAFESSADNLVSGDTNGYADIFVKDLSCPSGRRV
jgi:Tol biopolymer transport system component